MGVPLQRPGAEAGREGTFRRDGQTQNPGLQMAERTAIEWTEPLPTLVGLRSAGLIRATVISSGTIGTAVA
jgi:hypothetical protein